MIRYWLNVISLSFNDSITTIGQSLLALLYLAIVSGLGALQVFRKGGFAMLKQHVAENVVAVVVIAIIAWLPFFIWSLAKTPAKLAREQAAELEKAKQEASRYKQGLQSDRPLVIIEELTSEEIRERVLGSGRNPVPRGGVYPRAYAMGMMTSGGEVIFYRVRNISPHVARNISYVQQVKIIASSGKETDVPVAPEEKSAQVILPEQAMIRQAVLPPRTVYTGTSHDDSSQIRVRLTVKWSGAEQDLNTYYYTVALKAHRAKDVETMNRRSIGGLVIEETDQGIVKQP